MAQKGNKNGIKLKDPSIRQQAYHSYCDWLASGMPKEAWYFDREKHLCVSDTIEKYIRDNPLEFPPIHITIANKKRYLHWINKGIDMLDGKQEKCQPAIYQMFMRNMFGWDKEAQNKAESTEPLVKRLAQAWRNADHD